MAKNPRRHATQNPQAQTTPRKPMLSKRGKKVMGGGIVLVILGYFILTMTDPAGQNWASTVSPLLLVLGYGLIGVGIVVSDPAAAPENTSSPQS
jgi:hypothetical protein